MRIKSMHENFIMPTKGSDKAGAFDIYMPESGFTDGRNRFYGLGFAAAIPEGYAALILPRSGIGAKYGLELNNTVGLIDSDYRGEWKAALRTKDGQRITWTAGERFLQFVVVPIPNIQLELVKSLDVTARGEGGFGSTGT